MFLVLQIIYILLLWVVISAGTTKIKNLESNIGALNLKLKHEDLKELSELIPMNEVAGDRTYISMDTVSWRVADTPLKGGNA